MQAQKYGVIIMAPWLLYIQSLEQEVALLLAELAALEPEVCGDYEDSSAVKIADGDDYEYFPRPSSALGLAWIQHSIQRAIARRGLWLEIARDAAFPCRVSISIPQELPPWDQFDAKHEQSAIALLTAYLQYLRSQQS